MAYLNIQDSLNWTAYQKKLCIIDYAIFINTSKTINLKKLHNSTTPYKVLYNRQKFKYKNMNPQNSH